MYERIIDNSNPNRFAASANWWTATPKEGKYGADYRAANPATVPDGAWWKFDIPVTKDYDVYYWHPIGGSTSMPFGVYSPTHINAGGDGFVWQNLDLLQDYGKWRHIGRFRLPAGDGWVIGCTRLSSGFGVCLADAVKVVEVPDDPFTTLLKNTKMLVGPSPLSGMQPYMVTDHLVYLGNGTYRFGCNNDSRHHGIDYGIWTKKQSEEAKNAPVYSWGRGEVLYNRFDTGGYNRYIGVYYPDAGPQGKTLELGHLLNGSVQFPVGTWFQKGQMLARIGTWIDGAETYSHVHFRSFHGKLLNPPIGPCRDEDPKLTWRALGLPESAL